MITYHSTRAIFPKSGDAQPRTIIETLRDCKEKDTSTLALRGYEILNIVTYFLLKIPINIKFKNNF